MEALIGEYDEEKEKYDNAKLVVDNKTAESIMKTFNQA
jgi:hypothetical protein